MPTLVPPPSPNPPPASTLASRAVRTLAVDMGGTGLKALILGPGGKALTERVRVETPRPATPKAVLRALRGLLEPLEPFDRVSVGFPGVVVEGVVKTAPNLHERWKDFPLGKTLADATRRPVRVLNDAGVQGYGVVQGKGVEILLTLGTGMGFALFHEGDYVPNIELAHHPLRHGKTYEERVCNAELERVGKKRWNKRVAQVLAQVQPIFNPRWIYLGGGNARHVTVDLPHNVSLSSNVAGLLGGIALWHDVKR